MSDFYSDYPVRMPEEEPERPRWRMPPEFQGGSGVLELQPDGQWLQRASRSPDEEQLPVVPPEMWRSLTDPRPESRVLARTKETARQNQVREMRKSVTPRPEADGPAPRADNAGWRMSPEQRAILRRLLSREET